MQINSHTDGKNVPVLNIILKKQEIINEQCIITFLYLWYFHISSRKKKKCNPTKIA